MPDLSEKTPTLALDALQRELEERRQVVGARAHLVQRVQIGRLVLVVVVRHRDEQRVAQARALEHERLQGASRAAVAVEKGVHCSDVVVQGKGLDERVVVAETSSHRFGQAPKCLGAFLAALGAAMPRRAEGHVLVPRPQPARRAVVIVTTRDEPSVHAADQLLIDWQVLRKASHPAIGGHRRRCLLLRARPELLGRLAHRSVQLLVRELRPLDARSSGDLALELDVLKLLSPRALVGHLREGQDGRLWTQQCL